MDLNCFIVFDLKALFFIYKKQDDVLEHADDESRELLEVLLAAELGVEEHDQVARRALRWTSLQIIAIGYVVAYSVYA